MHKRWVADVGADAVGSWFFHSFSGVYDWALLAYHICLVVGVIQLLFLNFYTLFGTLSALNCPDFALFFSADLSIGEAFFFFHLWFLHLVSHDDHSELLLHNKIILLYEFFLVFFRIAESTLKFFDSIDFTA